MKKILSLFLITFSLASNSAENYPVYNFPITRVIDGDTVEFEAKFLPPPLKPVLSIRVYGVDTPEKGFRAQCDIESKKGDAATAYTKSIVSHAKQISIVIRDWDKFGGRVLGDIIIDGKNLRNLLIDNGYAREYYGDKKKSWCD